MSEERASTERVIILDFGSQYNQLILRRVRENRVFCELLPCTATISELKAKKPKGIILSGGPASVFSPDAPKPSPELFSLGIPILGICYGLQAMIQVLGGQVKPAHKKEYGASELSLGEEKDLFSGIPSKIPVWMSHGDHVTVLPPGFRSIAHTPNSPYAAVIHTRKNLYGVQFHPEVVHTPHGRDIIKNFLYRVCKCSGDWTMSSFIEQATKEMSEIVGGEKAICGLSGGIDSSVTALLVHRAIGDRLICVFVDNGLLREGEAETVVQTFRDHFHLNLRHVKAEKSFLKELRKVRDPERKRKIIGEQFIRVFADEAAKLGKIDFLAQGTLYPDVIESQSAKGGPSVTIKSHHNVGGLPSWMKLRLLEPLRDLFKDEVRMVGRELGIPEAIIGRQPFPGPGLAIRIAGHVSSRRLRILRQADTIVTEEMQAYQGISQVWQSFPVLLPVRSVGVMGDARTYEYTIAVRAVTSQDGMTADWVKLPYDILDAIARRIMNEVRGVNRVVYDISSKPPSTIEWE